MGVCGWMGRGAWTDGSVCGGEVGLGRSVCVCGVVVVDGWQCVCVCVCV